MIKRLWKDESGLSSLLWFTMFSIFLMLPLAIIFMFWAKMMFLRNILMGDVDQALVGAITDVQKVNYTSSAGDQLWYYKIDETGGTTQPDGSILLNSSASPVWSAATQAINADLANYPSVALTSTISISLTQNTFTQKVDVYSGGIQTSSYTVSNTDYVDAQVHISFTIPASFPVNIMEQLYGGGSGTPNTVQVTFDYPKATVQQPTLSVNH